MELGERQKKLFVRAIMPKLYELLALYDCINELDNKKPYEQQHQRGPHVDSPRITRLKAKAKESA